MNKEPHKKLYDDNVEEQLGFFAGVKEGWVDRYNSIKNNLSAFKNGDRAIKLRLLGKFFINYALFIFIIIYIITVSLINPRFVNLTNIVNILKQASVLLMVSIGMAGIIVLTGADLSASSIVYFVAVFISTLIPNVTKQLLGGGSGVYLINGLVLPLIIVFVISMIVGGAVGGINGVLVAKFKVHPFIGTMAVNFVFGASAITLMFLTMLGGQGTSVQIDQGEPIIKLVTSGISIGGVVVPNIIWFSFLLAIAVSLLWNKTRFGRNMFAVGCNQEAARVAGVNVKLVIILVFVLAGICYGYAAFFGVGIYSGGSQSAYGNLGLYAIAACVIGGVSFSGGIGSIKGVIFGVLLFQLIRNSTDYAGLSPSIGNMFIGVIVALAVIFDMLKFRGKG